jgi:uncharacterized protein YhfF
VARVDGKRSLELGTPGQMRARLNRLVLERRKRATAGLSQSTCKRALEHVGERLAVLDDHGEPVVTVEITGVDVLPLAEVSWEFVAAEGEGDGDVEEWRAGHRHERETETPPSRTTRKWCVFLSWSEATD